eukprot:CAMPEP_0174703536 /NCGR_PEP_ID=MMETSP1094-20130205/7444_1 /TAXON_ID=156173 /ORGANISM="Chrysochromulina brevifilum, Strain UTEX LB 985" /LENGTH=1008 /DNA_ID=CAMNT_0015901471 /DNA_START=155 /DNA_END=3181 /DNA_ORIENTATION=+
MCHSLHCLCLILICTIPCDRDYSVLFQKRTEPDGKQIEDRDPWKVQRFKKGLAYSQVWYTHAYAVTIMQPDLPVGFNGPSYTQSGWCTAESALSSLIKSNSLRIDIGKFTRNRLFGSNVADEIAESAAGTRMPPLLPSVIKKALQEKTFFNPKADREVVFNLYKDVFDAVVPYQEVLKFAGLRWGHAEAEGLAQALPSFSKLRILDLWNNAIGAAGVRVLLKALVGKSWEGAALIELNLGLNDLGDEGIIELSHTIRGASQQFSRLQKLNLLLNDFGDGAASELGEALCQLSSLTKLYVSGNGVKELERQGTLVTDVAADKEAMWLLRSTAALCARTGSMLREAAQVDEAVGMHQRAISALRLLVELAPLGAEAEARVNEAAVEGLGMVPLRLAKLLLDEPQLNAPWPDLLAELLPRNTAVTDAFVLLAASHLDADRRRYYGTGVASPTAHAQVLGWSQRHQAWRPTQVLDVLPDGSMACSFAEAGIRRALEQRILKPEEVVYVSNGGLGALLRAAAKVGHEPLARSLLEASISPFEADSRGTTALHIATSAGEEAICRLLMSHKASPLTFDATGLRPRSITYMLGHSRIRRLFAPSVSDQDVAIALGQDSTIDATQHLLRKIATGSEEALSNEELTHLKGAAGVTGLMLAARGGHLALVKAFVQHDPEGVHARSAGPPAKDGALKEGDRGCSALDMAAEEGHLEVVNFLLDHGAVAVPTDGSLHSPLTLASQNGHTAVCEALLHRSEPKRLIEFQDSTRDTALMHAAGCGCRTELVDCLLRWGADPNATNSDTWVAIFPASLHGHAEILSALFKAGANVNHVHSAHSKGIALHFCAERGHLEAVQECIKAKAQLDHIRGDGLAAMHLAARRGHELTVQLLLNAGATMELRSETAKKQTHYMLSGSAAAKIAEVQLAPHEGATALHFAAENGHEAVVRLLLNRKVAIDSRRADGSTALHLACSNRWPNCAQLLMNAGADALLQRNDGKTALNIAEQEGLKLSSPEDLL